MNDLAWCAIAHMDYPDVVRRVHESYIHAGADVIIANTFGTAPHVIKRLGLEDQIAGINQTAVRLALEARDNAEETSVLPLPCRPCRRLMNFSFRKMMR